MNQANWTGARLRTQRLTLKPLDMHLGNRQGMHWQAPAATFSPQAAPPPTPTPSDFAVAAGVPLPSPAASDPRSIPGSTASTTIATGTTVTPQRAPPRHSVDSPAMNPMWAKYVQDSTHVGLPGRPWRRSRLDVRPACPLRRWLAVDPKTNLDSLAARLVYVHVQHGWCPTPEVSACCVFPAGHTVLLLDRVLLPMLTRRSNLTAVLMNHVITLSPSMVHSQLLVPVLFQPAHHHSHTNRD